MKKMEQMSIEEMNKELYQDAYLISENQYIRHNNRKDRIIKRLNQLGVKATLKMEVYLLDKNGKLKKTVIDLSEESEKNYIAKFVGARGPFTDYNGKSISIINIDKSNFPKIRKKYNIKKEEYDEMIECVGVWVVNKKNNCKSFIFVSTNGTPKMIVISELFLKELLNRYNK